MGKTVISIKLYNELFEQHSALNQTLTETSTKLADSKVEIEKLTVQLRSKELTIVEEMRDNDKLRRENDELLAKYLAFQRKHWWQFWKPKYLTV